MNDINTVADSLPKPGEQEVADYSHTGPDTLAGRLLRKFWHPVYVSAELANEWSVPLTIMGENFTLYRGASGKAFIVGSRCAHRGLQLSTGIVEGDEIRCVYHGWKYTGEGQCTDQPAEPRPFCEKIKIPSVPVEEYLGLIFAYFGDGTPPPMVRYPAFEESDGFLTIPFRQIHRWNYFQKMENSLDESHVSFAHAISSFRELNFDVPQIAAEETDYGLVQKATRLAGVERQTRFHMPNMTSWCQPNTYPEEQEWREAMAWRVPKIDQEHWNFVIWRFHVSEQDKSSLAVKMMEERDRTDDLLSRTEASDIFAGRMRFRDLPVADNPIDDLATILLQDMVVQQGQGLIADRSDEHLGSSDNAIILLRKLYSREMRAIRQGTARKQWANTVPMPVSGQKPVELVQS